jgi:hypothetical protein
MTPTRLELGGATLSTETLGHSNVKLQNRGYHAFQSTVPTAGFQSILFGEGQNRFGAACQVAPDYFSDLNLDQIVDSIVAGREEYDLKSFFHLSLTSIDEIHYRQVCFMILRSHGKIIAYAAGNPRYVELQNYADIRSHILREIDHFFAVYKDLEGKQMFSAGKIVTRHMR